MALLAEVTKKAKELPDAREHLLSLIEEQITWDAKQKSLAQKILWELDVYNLEVYEIFVHLPRTEVTLTEEDYNSNENIKEIVTYVEDLCKKLNLISSLLVFSLGGYFWGKNKEIVLKIDTIF